METAAAARCAVRRAPLPVTRRPGLTTVAACGSRNDAVTYALVRRFFGNGGLLAVERIGRGIPFPRNITVTIECHQRLGTRLQAEPAGSEVARTRVSTKAVQLLLTGGQQLPELFIRGRQTSTRRGPLRVGEGLTLGAASGCCDDAQLQRTKVGVEQQLRLTGGGGGMGHGAQVEFLSAV